MMSASWIQRASPELYKQTLTLIQTENIADWQAEQTVFNATHAEVGAYLLGALGLPDGIVEALAYHHNPCRRARTMRSRR